MSTEGETGKDPGSPAEPAWRRRRRIEAIFGDVLPDQTRDDLVSEASESDPDAWLKSQVPPHHG